MTIGSSTLPYLRVRVVPKFPAVVEGVNGTKVTKENGVYSIGPAMERLIEVAAIPDATFVQIWDEQADTF